MKNRLLTIMLLGGGRKVSLAKHFKESGKKLGFHVSIISYDLSLEVPVILEAEVIKGLPWSDPDVVGDICRECEEKNVNILLPINNGAIEVASMCRIRLNNLFIPVTDFSVAKPLFDKVEAAQLFKKEKFPIPRTYSVLSAKLPAIVKPRKGGKARGIKIFNDMEDLMHLHNLSGYIIQEYISNSAEFTVDSYIDAEGKILTTVPRERLEVMGGESTRTKTTENKFLEKFAREVIDRLNLRGPVNIQFLHDIDKDRYLLMEVNPRLGGGVMCSILAGAPILEYIIREATGMPLEECNDWRRDTLMARYMMETVFFND